MTDTKKTTQRWVIYEMPIKLKNEVKVYAIRNQITVAEALSLIIEDWLEKINKGEEKLK